MRVPSEPTLPLPPTLPQLVKSPPSLPVTTRQPLSVVVPSQPDESPVNVYVPYPTISPAPAGPVTTLSHV